MFARGGFSVAGPVLLVLAVTFSQIPPPQSLRAQPLRGKVAATDNDDAPFLLAPSVTRPSRKSSGSRIVCHIGSKLVVSSRGLAVDITLVR
jgi:hypothetical protein